jgi:quinoprotein glucose dehydrogenase
MSFSETVKSRPVILGSVLILIGAILAIGGAWLTILGGSWYYIITGIAVLVSGIFLWRRNRAGAWLYAAMLVWTVVWAFVESGFNGWALAPRILPPAALGLWFLIPGVRNKLIHGPHVFTRGPGETDVMHKRARPSHTMARGIALFSTVSLIALAYQARTHAAPSGPVSSASPRTFAADSASPSARTGEWTAYGGNLAGQRYSPLTQINAGNVSNLKQAWSFETGDKPRPGETAPREFTFEVTPLTVNDSIYLCTPHNQVIALDPTTGQQKWRYDPNSNTSQAFVIACRGVSYIDTAMTGPCAKRIIGATIDARLFEVDADTGRVCTSFGKEGFVNLLENMGEVKPGYHYETSPPTVVKNHIVLGGWINDNQSTSEPSGVIRSFDAMTGQLQWAWDMGAPDRIGAPPAGQEYTRDTPNAWSVFAADPDLNLVYVPTGNAPPDFFGGHRRAFDDKYSSSVVAIDLDNGRPKWSFQTTHHDLWDYDVPAQPVLVDIPRDGQIVPALVQATKRGELFVLDRRNGQPVYSVTEKPAPQGAVPGERLSPTQPFSALSLLPPKLKESDMWGITPIDQMMCRIAFKSSRYEGIFTPQGTKPVINYPGALGVVDWGGVAFDPANAMLVANSSAVPYRDTLVPRDKAPKGRTEKPTTMLVKGKAKPGADYAWSPQVGTPYVMHTEPFMSALDVPCTQPPWGFLQAIDLKTGKFAWKRTIGTAHDSGPLGIPSMLPIQMGVPNLGGSIVTGGGLIFNGSTLDRYLRAYDENSGKMLWQARLPAGGQATPISYQGKDGRQYVLIAAGGHQGMATKIGDYVVAYALPNAPAGQQSASAH